MQLLLLGSLGSLLHVGAFGQTTQSGDNQETISRVITVIDQHGGVIITYNGGKTWQQLDPATATKVQDQLARKVSAGRKGSGMVGQPTTYPNPATGTSSIHYELSRQGEVSVTLYDTYGREMLPVFEGTQAAGEHTLALDVSSLPDGVYIYRFSISNTVIAGSTMVVMR